MNEHVQGARKQANKQEKSPEAETSSTEFDAITWGAEEALRALVEYQIESLRFMARRTYGNLELLRHLRHCAGWAEITQVQKFWFKQCLGDYGEEAGRLVAIGFQLARNDFTPLQWLMYRGKDNDGPEGLPTHARRILS